MRLRFGPGGCVTSLALVACTATTVPDNGGAGAAIAGGGGSAISMAGIGGAAGAGGVSAAAGVSPVGGSAGSSSAGGSGVVDGGSAGSAGSASGGSSGEMLSGDGCVGKTCLNPECKPLGAPSAPGATPQLAFEDEDVHPSYLPNDVIIPTLDDVPDGVNAPVDPAYGAGAWTAKILDYLEQNSLHWDLFINTNNWCGDVTQDDACQSTLLRILKTQNPGNHTVHHLHMGQDSPPLEGVPQSCDGASSAASCIPEIEGVETLVDTLSKGGRPHLTRFRPPFGEPYFGGNGQGQVEAEVAKYAVAVGWSIDSHDADYNGNSCAKKPCPTGQAIADNVLTKLGSAPGSGQWGVVLMHGVFPWSYDAIRILFGDHGNDGEIAKRGFRVGTVEDAICWRFGKHSWQLVEQANPGTTRAPN